jgi:hypothetical protein
MKLKLYIITLIIFLGLTRSGWRTLVSVWAGKRSVK